MQVPLGEIKKSENKLDEMCSILKELHNYVTAERVTLNLALPAEDAKLLDTENFHQTLLGGDQLTAARARSSCEARVDHGSSKRRLSGVLPVIEDWHSKMCYLKVSIYLLCVHFNYCHFRYSGIFYIRKVYHCRKDHYLS